MIQGKQIVLRTLREEDLDKMVTLAGDFGQIGPFWPIGLPSRHAMGKRFEENGFWGEEEGFLAITDREDRLLGTIGFFSVVHYFDAYEIGYNLFRKEDRGKGLGTEALRIFSAYIFALKPVGRLQLTAMVDNKPSRRIAEKCGFTQEGTLRHATFLRGRHWDLAMYSLLREECPSIDEVLKG
jgi:[ribosomal protein S5]-alanine N-acetyltransferase